VRRDGGKKSQIPIKRKEYFWRGMAEGYDPFETPREMSFLAHVIGAAVNLA
jgi:hypothetical protein